MMHLNLREQAHTMIAMAQKKKPTGSRHKDRVMLSLPTALYAQLKALADKNRRPVTWEARAIIEDALATLGMWPPPNGKP